MSPPNQDPKWVVVTPATIDTTPPQPDTGQCRRAGLRVAGLHREHGRLRRDRRGGDRHAGKAVRQVVPGGLERLDDADLSGLDPT